MSCGRRTRMPASSRSMPAAAAAAPGVLAVLTGDELRAARARHVAAADATPAAQRHAGLCLSAADPGAGASCGMSAIRSRSSSPKR